MNSWQPSVRRPRFSNACARRGLPDDKERRSLSEQIDSTKKQAVSERQRMADQLAAEKRRAEALDGIRHAELAIQTAETVDAPRYAKAKYTAATTMLQQAHKEFDAGHWDEALARTTLALAEAQGGLNCRARNTTRSSRR